MINNFTNEINKDLIKIEVEKQVLQEFLKVIEPIDELLKKNDKKTFNKRIANSIKKEKNIILTLEKTIVNNKNIGRLTYYMKNNSITTKQYGTIYADTRYKTIEFEIIDNRIDYSIAKKEIDKSKKNAIQALHSLNNIDKKELETLQEKRNNILKEIKDFNNLINETRKNTYLLESYKIY